MSVKKDYLNSVIETVKKIDPSLDESEIKEVASSIIKEYMKDPSIIMDNDVNGNNARISLTETCNWIDKEKPVVSGNATFYCQPEVLESPTSSMLRQLKKGRKAVKKEMFKFKAGSDEYESLDLDQQNKKVIMNAEYGASGAPTAAFYAKYSPAATTLMAQSIITTMAAFFEGYIGDNQKFFNVNECFDWMNTIYEKKKDKLQDWVYIPDTEEVYKRIVSHFYMVDIESLPYIRKYIENRSKKELVYLYYVNNLKGFIAHHPNIANIIKRILLNLPNYEVATNDVPDGFKDKFPYEENGDHIEKYNRFISREMFLDPYTVPESIKDEIQELQQLFSQFVYLEYITPDSIIKLNNHQRNTVLLVDTDSNMLNADIFVQFILRQIYPGETFGREKLYNEMILVNVLASCLAKNTADILDYWGRMHNMNEDARKEITMKNEFLFRRFFLMKKKKRYAASIVLREGNIIIPFKLELKGLDFIKAGVTEEVSKKFTKMLEEHVLYSDDIELHALMRDLRNFEKEIYHDLKEGGTKYFKLSMYKDAGAYANGKAWQLPVFRGTSVWNEIYPETKINSLDRVKIIKTVITDISDLDRIKNKYPKEYNDIIMKIYNSSSPDIRKAGLKVICVPMNMKKLPGWITEIIDYDIIISDTISSFRSVLDALNIEEMYYKTANGNASLTSCLVAI